MRHRACGALIRDGKILMVRHVEKGMEYWTLPGGGIHPGETSVAAAVREMREETGLETRVVRLLWEKPFPGGDLDICLLMELTRPDQVEARGGDPEEAHLPQEGRMLQEVRWWPLGEKKSDIQVAWALEALKSVEGTSAADILGEMQRYYEVRAPEYDDWWEKRGRYDLGPEKNRAVKAEADEVRTMVDALPFDGDVIEFAGGTGIWTAYLARRARRLLVLDGAVAMLKLNQERLATEGLLHRVRFEHADLFTWKPSVQHDAAWASFWVSHIPADRLDDFFVRAAAALRPGGVLAILEGQPARPRAPQQGTARVDNDVEIRTLKDSSTWRIVKREMHADELAASLERAGFVVEARTTATNFLLMIATKRR